MICPKCGSNRYSYTTGKKAKDGSLVAKCVVCGSTFNEPKPKPVKVK